MFDSLGWPEIVVLIVAGLFILGPERLPGAARWLGRTIGQVKTSTAGAQSRIRSEFGSDFDEIAEAFNDLTRRRRRRAAFDALMRDDHPPAPPANTPQAGAPAGRRGASAPARSILRRRSTRTPPER